MSVSEANPFQSYKYRNHSSPSLLRYGQKKITLCNILLSDKHLIKTKVPLSINDVEQNILKRYQIKMLQYNNKQLPQPPLYYYTDESKERLAKQPQISFQQTEATKSKTILINPFQNSHAIQKNIGKNTIVINKLKDSNTHRQSPISQGQFTRKQIMRLRNEIRDKQKRNKKKQNNSVINLYKYKGQPNQHLNSSKDKYFEKSIAFTLLQSSYSFKVPPL